MSRGSALRDDALTLLAALPASVLRDRYVEHLRKHEDGMYRTCSPGHVTASMLVLSEDHRFALLTHHAKARQWFQFGGHCEPGDATLAGAATREAVEESGIDELTLDPVPVQLSEHAVPFCDPRGGVHHLDVRFVAVVGDTDEHTVSEESLDVRWWPADALPAPEPDLVELVALARARRTGSDQSTPSLPGGDSTWDAADQPSR